ncbi:hypothetical protein SALBM311S_04584 [Streptomyces alboniger]
MRPMSNQDETPDNRLRKQLPEEAPAGAAPEVAGADAPEVAGADAQDGSRLTGRQRLAKGLWPPRVTRAQLIVAVLLFGLAPGHGTAAADSGLMSIGTVLNVLRDEFSRSADHSPRSVSWSRRGSSSRSGRLRGIASSLSPTSSGSGTS